MNVNQSLEVRETGESVPDTGKLLPLANALAHNLVAAHLLACCVLARGSLSLHHHDPLPSPGMVRSRT